MTPLTLATSVLVAMAVGAAPASRSWTDAAIGMRGEAQAVSLALTHVTIIDPGSGSRASDMTVLMSGPTIVAISPSAATVVPKGAIVHDAAGRFAIPGLWDAHVHLGQIGVESLPLLVASGVTSVRDMGSDPALVARLRHMRASGAAIPRILSPGPMLDGGTASRHPPANRPDRRIVSTPAEARKAVDDLAGGGADFIKVHNGMSREIFDSVAGEARRLGIPFAGHTPDAGPVFAARSGQVTIEHGRGMLPCSSRDWAYIRAHPAARDDAQLCLTVEDQDAMFAAMIRNGTRFTPTLVSWRAQAMVGTGGAPWQLGGVGFRQIPVALRRRWLADTPGKLTVFERRLVSRFPSLAADASRAGVDVLAGTDSGEPGIAPGLALHEELEMLVAAGFSPAEVLRSATSRPAAAFGLVDTLGSLTIGKRADIVIVDDDPIVDIRNARCVRAVILDGRLVNVAARRPVGWPRGCRKRR